MRVLRLHRGEEVEQLLGRQREAVGLEDLRADVAVQAKQFDAVRSPSPRRRLPRPRTGRPGSVESARHGEAELLVLVRGGNEFVRVRVHAGGEPQHHLGGLAAGRGDFGDALQLREAVHDDPAQLHVQRAVDFGVGLVVAVQARRRRRGCRRGAATASSPPEAVSSRSPSSSTQRTTAVQRNDLPA